MTVTAKDDAELVPQELLAVTVIFPPTALADVETVIELVLAPDVMLHPEGSVQVYDVALGTAAMLYVNPVLLTHCSAAPVMIPGATGAAGLTVIFVGVLVAVKGFAQGAFDVMTTVTTSPFTKAVVVKVGLLVPVLVPLIFH